MAQPEQVIYTFPCTQQDCQFVGLTSNQLSTHTVEAHSMESQQVIHHLQTPVNNIDTMTTQEIAVLLAKILDSNTLDEIMYKLYTIRMTNYWKATR